MQLLLFFLTACNALTLDTLEPSDEPSIGIETRSRSVMEAGDGMGEPYLKWPGDTPDGWGDLHSLIWHHQHPEDCSKVNFLLANRTSIMAGIGSLSRTFSRMLLIGLQTNRVVLSAGWITAECETKNFDCYFQPLSSCTLDDVPPQREWVNYKHESELWDSSLKAIWYHAEWYPKIGQIAENLTFAPYRSPLLMNWEEGKQRYEDWYTGHERFKARWVWFRLLNFQSVGQAYFLRMNPDLQAVVEANVRASIPKWFNGSRAISMPIRGSDKCKQVAGSAPPELKECVTLEVLFMHAERIRKHIDPSIDTVILTSESEQNYEGWEKYEDEGWKFVFNVADVQQGTGSAQDWKNHKQDVTVTKVIQSSMSSLHLQLRAKYSLTMTIKSNWNLLIAEACLFVGACSEDAPMAFDVRKGKKPFDK